MTQPPQDNGAPLAQGPAPGALLQPLLPAKLQNWEDAYERRYAATLEQAKSDEFKAGMEEAHHILIDLVRHELIRRAFMPYRRPIFQKGVQVAEEHTYDNRLLLAVAERLSPDEFNLARRLEVSGRDGGAIRFAFNPGEDDDEPELIEDADYHELPPGPQDT